jgi:pyrroline-5-carboxylate reductase
MDESRILIVGCGNMGGALLSGWLASGRLAQSFTVVDPVLESAPAGVTLLRDPPSEAFDLLVLGIKPQMLDTVAPSLKTLAGSETTVLSILAGVELDSLAGHFPDAAAIVRLMPNLSAALGKSPLALATNAIQAERKAALEAAIAPLGVAEWLDEAQFDLVTALAGSGPAFVYRFIDALASGAEVLGMSREQADRLALATVEGAVALAASSDAPPGELARRVASPGGTTEAGLKVLDDGDAMARLMEATLRAARDRGAEMAAQSRGRQ